MRLRSFKSFNPFILAPALLLILLFGTSHPAAAQKPTVSSAIAGTGEEISGQSSISYFYMPLFLGDGNVATGVAISNVGGTPAEVTFEAFSVAGEDLWPAVVWNSSASEGSGALEPGQQRARLVREIFGIESSQERRGWLRLSSTSPQIRVVYQFVTAQLDQLDGMNSVNRASDQLVFPWLLEGVEAYRGQPARTDISIVNPGDQSISVTIRLVDNLGEVRATVEEELPSHSMLLRSATELFPAVTPEGIIVAETSGDVILGSELVTLGEGAAKSFVVSNALYADLQATRLYSAQVARVGGLVTDFRAINTSGEPQTLDLRLRGADGALVSETQDAQLQPGGFFEADLGELFQLPEGTTGTLEVSGQGAGIVGSVLFGDASRGYAAALPLQPESTVGLVFPHVAYLQADGERAGFFTGLALHAPGPLGAEGVIDVLDQEGVPTASGPFSLGPGARLSQLISELVPLEEQAGGYVRVRTDGNPVVAQELFGDTKLRMLSAVPAFPDPLQVSETAFIVVDQFGYRPESEKIAVIRDPVTGFDAEQSFQPGATYALIDAVTARQVMTGAPVQWRSGAEDASSGDRAWWFDFSAATQPGTYYVLDVEKNLRSSEFSIGEGVYREVLEHAVRTFFYQRAGFPKEAEYAGAAWADGASHLGPLQDANCRRYDRSGDPSTERDLSGGWYDAGDYNKYTNWTAGYVVQLLRIWEENRAVFGDDLGLPESGNGIPDLLDEAKWGMDWLVKMQNPNGSVLSIVGLSHASPPSAASGPSKYGTESTSATLSSAAAYAYGAKVFRLLNMSEMTAYSDDLRDRAVRAWNWAEANDDVLFYNNQGGTPTQGLGAGQQETDDYGRLVKRIEAACYLFEVTGEEKYRTVVDANYGSVHLIAWNFAYPFEQGIQDVLLYYSSLDGATAEVATRIRNTYSAAIQSSDNLTALRNELDPYRAFLATQNYTWGSNSTKSNKGNMFMALVTYGFDTVTPLEARLAAERYLHYLHGVNPQGLVYLSNMYDVGAERSVNEFYHSWFANGSALWDRVGVSQYGPAPGFLTGGPNPSYDWDGCCPNRCGSSQNNALCQSESIVPPKDQPAQKSYKDFNTSWPLNSWSVTENSNGYQVAYIRLLSKFVAAPSAP